MKVHFCWIVRLQRDVILRLWYKLREMVGCDRTISSVCLRKNFATRNYNVRRWQTADKPVDRQTDTRANTKTHTPLSFYSPCKRIKCRCDPVGSPDRQPRPISCGRISFEKSAIRWATWGGFRLRDKANCESRDATGSSNRRSSYSAVAIQRYIADSRDARRRGIYTATRSYYPRAADSIRHRLPNSAPWIPNLWAAKGCKSVFPPTIMVLHGNVTVFREINCPQASIFVFSCEKLFHEFLKVSNWKLLRYLFMQNVLFDVWKLKKTAPIFGHRFVTTCIT